MKEEDCITSEEIAALIERTEARALKEGDAEIITAVIKKMVEIEHRGPDHVRAQAPAADSDCTTQAFWREPTR